MTDFRDKLSELMRLLRETGDDHSANQIEGALVGSDESLRAYLVSNELWGGAGSIADQGGLNGSDDFRSQIQAQMLHIGRMQMSMRMVNVRTEMWVDAFEHWQKNLKQ